MLNKTKEKQNQIQMFCIEDSVPKDRLLRKIERAIDWSFICTQCTESKSHTKIITQHIWDKYLEICEDIRYARGSKELYQKRKETVERLFGTAKEHHGFGYTQMIGKAKMEMKVGLTFACLNLKN